ncbi:head GIN domain-containing protein [Fluviicola sp.]|uniref:head GIN domain-containing protein n=1 Tax=Fluviicola sp. TaxID=1917219 RepID=UPI00260920ED|nr:head GIN domain-containing protein [Fluviicola sp.]
MTEDKLSGLFDEIRNESAQTSVSEVNQWIETAAAGAATIGLLATLKLFLIKKPLIMWSAFATLAGGASLSAIVLFSQPEVKEKQVDKPAVSHSQPVKKFNPVETEIKEETITPILEEAPIEKTKEEAPVLPEDMGVRIPARTPELETKKALILSLRTPQITGDFNKIDVAGAISVELTQGNSCSVEVTPETAKDLVRIEIKNGTLHLSNEPNKRSNRNERIIVKVTMPTLERVDMSGATNLVSMNQFNVKYLVIGMTGASDLKLKVNAATLKGDISGATNLKLDGTCENMDLDLSGAAQANLFDLSAKKATIDNSGAAHAEISVSEVLVLDGSGASVTYYQVSSGAEKIRVDIETSGSATAKKK